MSTFTASDYEMIPVDLVVNVDPEAAYVEVKLPYVGESAGALYSINNIGTSGNTVHIVDRGDSMGFESADDLPSGGAVLYFSNGTQWLLVFSNVAV